MSKIQVDFWALFRIVKADKRRMSIYLGITAVFAVIVAFSIPKIYKTQVMLAPESSGNSLSSNLSSLADMVGMSSKLGMGDDAIFPEIYPDVMGSTNFQTSLFNVKVKTQDGKIATTYYDYLLKHQKVTWWSYPGMWLGALLESLKTKKAEGGNGSKVNPFQLTKKQSDIAASIGHNITCSVDKKTSEITIEVTDQDPLISATMADSVKTRLQAFITDYRTNKARNDLAYMEKLFRESKAQYVKARQQYATYSDANQDLILVSYKSKQEDLENEMQLQYNIYTQVAEQLQMARAKVQERTPAFTVVQNASVPIKHSSTPKVYILAMFLFIAFTARVLFLVYKNKESILFISDKQSS